MVVCEKRAPANGMIASGTYSSSAPSFTREFVGLHRRQSFVARPVDARGAGGGQLHAGARANIYFQRELIAAEQSAGNIVQMRERRVVLHGRMRGQL